MNAKARDLRRQIAKAAVAQGVHPKLHRPPPLVKLSKAKPTTTIMLRGVR
jgi:hypothetical protein